MSPPSCVTGTGTLHSSRGPCGTSGGAGVPARVRGCAGAGWTRQSELKSGSQGHFLPRHVGPAATTWPRLVHGLGEITHRRDAGRVHPGLRPGACMLFLIPGAASAHAPAPQPLLALHMQRNPITRRARRSAGPAQLRSRRCLHPLFLFHARASRRWRLTRDLRVSQLLPLARCCL